MKYLGIDYGSKRVGVAISDEEKSFAFPLDIIPNNLNLLNNILTICESQQIERIIIGESKDLSGKDNEIMGEINEFKQKLEEHFPVFFEKEFMTSIEAQGREGKEINNARKAKKKEKKKVDDSAAALILQRYLDRL
ncbi:MAG: Holliday junction resolvase RuvX [Patescibacteria group bacterium]|nr:Holliday junction resolvase RuvX [Patescibacteria group bacterium]